MYNNRTSIFVIAAAICLLCVTASCQKPVGATYSGEGGFAFASNVLNVELTPEDDGLLNVPLYRSSLDVNGARVRFEYDVSESGSSNPIWSETDPDGVFSLLSGKVNFADVAYRSYAKISFSDVSALGFSSKYRMRLYIEGNSSPSNRDTTVLTVSRKLTFEEIGECSVFDHCMFDNAYTCKLFKARECDVYRVMDPFTQGLIAEEYAQEGLMQNPPAYIQFECHADGLITFEPFPTGMLVPTPSGALCMAWVYYPGEYRWGKDFSRWNAENRKVSQKLFQLYGVHCLPDFQYGFLDEGIYAIDIVLP